MVDLHCIARLTGRPDALNLIFVGLPLTPLLPPSHTAHMRAAAWSPRSNTMTPLQQKVRSYVLYLPARFYVCFMCFMCFMCVLCAVLCCAVLHALALTQAHSYYMCSLLVLADAGMSFPDLIEHWSPKTFQQVGGGLSVAWLCCAAAYGMCQETMFTGALVSGYWYKGYQDLNQKSHTILRNFPVLGNFRYGTWLLLHCRCCCRCCFCDAGA